MAKKISVTLLTLIVVIFTIGFMNRGRVAFSWNTYEYDKYYNLNMFYAVTCGYKGLWVKDWEFTFVISNKCNNI
jgi:hypothetical protein